MSRGLPDYWWTTDLDDEPCDGCGVKPSKHAGHGSYTCESCYEKRWCPKCPCMASGEGPRLCDSRTTRQHEKQMRQRKRVFTELDIEYPEDE